MWTYWPNMIKVSLVLSIVNPGEAEFTMRVTYGVPVSTASTKGTTIKPNLKADKEVIFKLPRDLTDTIITKAGRKPEYRLLAEIDPSRPLFSAEIVDRDGAEKDRLIMERPKSQRVVYYLYKGEASEIDPNLFEKSEIIAYFKKSDHVKKGRTHSVIFKAVADKFVKNPNLLFRLPCPDFLPSDNKVYGNVKLVQQSRTTGPKEFTLTRFDGNVYTILSEVTWWDNDQKFRVHEDRKTFLLSPVTDTDKAGDIPQIFYNDRFAISALSIEEIVKLLLRPTADWSNNKGLNTFEGPQFLSTKLADRFMENLFLTHVMFMTAEEIVDYLTRLCPSLDQGTRVSSSPARDDSDPCIPRVYEIVACWLNTVGEVVFDDPMATKFVKMLIATAANRSSLDSKESKFIITELKGRWEYFIKGAKVTFESITVERASSDALAGNPFRPLKPLKNSDSVTFDLYGPDYTHYHVKCQLSTTAGQLKSHLMSMVAKQTEKPRQSANSKKQNQGTVRATGRTSSRKKSPPPPPAIYLAEVAASGVVTPFDDTKVGFPTNLLTVNGRLFFFHKLPPGKWPQVAEQIPRRTTSTSGKRRSTIKDGDKASTLRRKNGNTLLVDEKNEKTKGKEKRKVERVESGDKNKKSLTVVPTPPYSSPLLKFDESVVANYLSIIHRKLFQHIGVHELIYNGRPAFQKITSNFDNFRRHIQEIQFWVVTEIVSSDKLDDRVALIRKFINILYILRKQGNYSAFFAITAILKSNPSVSDTRLKQTWPKVEKTSEYKKFKEYAAFIEGTLNLKDYLDEIRNRDPPYILNIPKLVAEVTSAYEVDTFTQGMVTVFKINTIGKVLNQLNIAQREEANETNSTKKARGSRKKEIDRVALYFRNFKYIDDEATLYGLSQKVEPRSGTTILAKNT